ncbi:uncharacterized protein LOC126679506 [Mercurialis annua]|uniref:uncharacterized protein LOC126679506 n=1 Tax=Mercurialis annua TaxID=3986 RepID=UPI0021605A9A|nr:uncharacterized protein LOC126679506 [Mercurialis annua]
MTVDMASIASSSSSHSKKLMKKLLALSIFAPRFSSSKCKTAAKMAVARMKLLRNKREAVVRQMRRDIALLLQSKQDATARVRVEHVIREQNISAANEFIELFCELVVSRLTIIAKRRECPADLKEGIASLIFAAPRCAEIPELAAIVKIFERKYGKDFVSAATDLRPDCGVNRMLIDKLSVRTPTGEVKMKVLKEIAKEHQIDWDTAESEKELLKPPEERIEGADAFVSASSLPLKLPERKIVDMDPPTLRSSKEGAMGNIQFRDTASAAEAAAESAKQAIAAAQAAAHLANKHFDPASQAPGFLNASEINPRYAMFSGSPIMESSPEILNHQSQGPAWVHNASNEQARSAQRDGEGLYRRHSYNNKTRSNEMDVHNVQRRQSYNAPFPDHQMDDDYRRDNSNYSSSPNSEMKFDESDCDEEIEMEESPARSGAPAPHRPPPPVPRVHPKLPDYDSLAARFETLKHQKSQT